MNHDIHTIQPFIDGELAEAERAEVEALLARDPALRQLVEEQRRVRQALRDLPKQPAPQALRARVLLALDAIDREDAVKAAPPRPSRLRAFLRGGALMLPAGAAAFGMFLFARTFATPAALESSASAEPRGLASRPEFAVRIVDVPEDSPLQPVSLPTGDRIVYEVGPRRVIDHRERGAGGALPDRVRYYRGAHYYLGRGADGRPLVVFDVGGVRHTLREDVSTRPHGSGSDADLEALLELGHFVRTSADVPPRAR
ncbi:MAG TPA: hypothetical protein VIK91_27975 [Nannocystis sp.]